LLVFTDLDKLGAGVSVEGIEINVVYKPAIMQQEKSTRPVPIEAHVAELNHFGVNTIYGKCSTSWPNLVGPDSAPLTANVFAIASSDWISLQNRLSGAYGFREWLGSDYPELNLPEGLQLGPTVRSPIEDIPVLIRELIGRKYRAYQTGDSLDLSRDPKRVNIESNPDGTIVGLWIG